MRRAAARLAPWTTAALALVWIGLMIGVDLVAAAAPFRAEGVARPEALSVNREIFAAAAWAEWGFLLLLILIGGILRRPGRGVIAVVAALTVVVLAQTLWLLPALAARTDVILAGGDPGPAPYHGLYLGLEAIKLALLCALVATAPPAIRETSGLDGTR